MRNFLAGVISARPPGSLPGILVGTAGPTDYRAKAAVKPQKPLPQHWTTFAIGRSGIHLGAVAIVTKSEIRVELIFSGSLAKPHFHLLLKDKDAVEAELGMNVEWLKLPARKESHVVLRRSDSDPSHREEWPEQHAWLQDKLEAFHKVFGPRIKELNARELHVRADTTISHHGISESTVEDAALDWFEALGYTVLQGPEIAPGEPSAERTDFGEIVLGDRLELPWNGSTRTSPSRPARKPSARSSAPRRRA